MAFRPPITCPLCDEVLEPDQWLEDHLVSEHFHRELARYVAAEEGTAKPSSGDAMAERSLH